MLLGCVARHAARRRRVYALEERLAMLPREALPLEKQVVIHWNQHHVPFIEAMTDRDLAVALGIVHAHLRLGQLELMRRIARGRLSELIGSSGLAVDQLLRTLDVGRAVPEVLAAMPAATRTWLEAFVEGLNHQLMQVRPLPAEFDLFSLQQEPWSVSDILILGRFVSADVNWIAWFQLLKFRGDDDWPQLWRRLLAADNLTFGADQCGEALLPLAGAARSGSNSFAVAASRTITNAALIASDPHLSIILPNLWLLAAFKSPSYHAVGLMIPGLPFVALGRNPWIAWGGTSLHAASSDLVAITAEKAASMAAREVQLTVRWGRNRRFRIRETPWGPIVTDVPSLAAANETLALRWMGHRPSDEITAMLAVNRARNWAEFRTAVDGFAVPGQNMLYADSSGHIGRLMAVHAPRRRAAMSDDMAIQPGTGDDWDASMTSLELPWAVDPPEGFITSAYERPPDGSPFIGRHFSPPDRKRRLDQLLTAADRISFETAVRLQRDVHWEGALVQRRQLLAWLDVPAMEYLRIRHHRFIDEITNWDGRYDASSRGALAFELFCHHLARRLVSSRRRAAYGATWGSRWLIWDDVVAADPRGRQRALRHAARQAANAIGPRERPGAAVTACAWGIRWRFSRCSAGPGASRISRSRAAAIP
jgi:penicillin amidase